MDKYGPDVSVDFILDFMKRNRSEPMFVYYPMALPHRPMVPTPDSKEWKEPDRRVRRTCVISRTWSPTWTRR